MLDRRPPGDGVAARARRPGRPRARPRRRSPRVGRARTAGSTASSPPRAPTPAAPLGRRRREDWERVVARQPARHGGGRARRAAAPRARPAAASSPSPPRWASRVFSDATAYCASKFGVVGFTRALAAELAGRVGVTHARPRRDAHRVLRRPRRAVQARRPTRSSSTPAEWPRRCVFALDAAAGRRAARAGGDAVRWSRPGRDGPRLVVLRALGLGDLLTACRRCARSPRPSRHRRVLAAPAALAELARRAAGLDVLDVARRTHGVPPALPAAARRAPTSPSTSTAAGPRATAARATRARAACSASPAGGHDGPAWRADEHEVARWCRLLAQSRRSPPIPRDLRCDARRRAAAAPARGATLVHPGAARGARRWPAERWAAVARARARAGPAGGDHRRRRRGGLARGGRRARRARRRRRCWPGARPIARARRAVAGAGRVVCGDTGVAHLATALGTPSVVLFGPTSPARWGPPRDRPIIASCGPAGRGDPHADRPDPGLLAIGEDEVLQALEQLACAQTGDIPDRFQRPG